jgi:hypothetical protein
MIFSGDYFWLRDYYFQVVIEKHHSDLKSSSDSAEYITGRLRTESLAVRGEQTWMYAF